jgi:hypothetical protein
VRWSDKNLPAPYTQPDDFGFNSAAPTARDIDKLHKLPASASDDIWRYRGFCHSRYAWGNLSAGYGGRSSIETMALKLQVKKRSFLPSKLNIFGKY